MNMRKEINYNLPQEQNVKKKQIIKIIIIAIIGIIVIIVIAIIKSLKKIVRTIKKGLLEKTKTKLILKYLNFSINKNY